MAAIKCNQCCGVVAQDAKQCPHCGTENFDNNPLKLILKLVSIGFTLYIIYLLFDIGGSLRDMAGFLPGF